MTSQESPRTNPETESLESATIRFAGDSGDGIQLAGFQFKNASMLARNDIKTMPSFPAEIRAPKGTLYGISSIQVRFGAVKLFTHGSEVDTLVAMNPAALKTNLNDVRPGGTVIVNKDTFESSILLQYAGYTESPLDQSSVTDKYNIISVPFDTLVREIGIEVGLAPRQADKSRNFLAMGIACFMYGRDIQPIEDFIAKKFAKNRQILELNLGALKAGRNYAETVAIFPKTYVVPPAELPPGTYRHIEGNEAVCLGLLAASKLSNLPLFYASYPITPASNILHWLATKKEFGVKTFQAEDEIAAVTSAVGASFGGSLAVVGTSGPGIPLMQEGIGLATMIETPLVIIDVMRGGPSTGLPTKGEQTDLLEVIYGRNGECPCVVMAASSPSDIFDVVIEASRIAVRSMVPVFVLSDAFVANSTEVWRVPEPELSQYKKIQSTMVKSEADKKPFLREDGKFLPYKRNEQLSRPWAVPGTPDLMHRVGGLEGKVDTGDIDVSDGKNHEAMVNARAEKVALVANTIASPEVIGREEGDLLVIGWGSTAGAIREAVSFAQQEGLSVSTVHLRHLHPLPPSLGEIVTKFKKILIPELNSGQLAFLLKDKLLLDVRSLSKVQGVPFLSREILRAIKEELAGLSE